MRRRKRPLGWGATACEVASLALLLLTVLHLIGQFAWLDQSPIWANGMALVQDRALVPTVGAAPVWLLAMLFALFGVAAALPIGQWASRIAALCLLPPVGWEAYARGRELVDAIAAGANPGLPVKVGVAGTLLLLATAVLALVGSLAARR